MKNLMTRKTVLGILMTLVLAFSVQGIADAVEPPATGRPTSGSIYGSVKILETNVDRQAFTTLDITLTITGDKPNQLENISISASGGIDLKIGSNYLNNSVTLTEVEDDAGATTGYSYVDRYGGKHTATATLTAEFTSKGKKTIRISGTNYWDHDSDGGTTPLQPRSWSYTYYYYVSEPDTSLAETATVNLKGLTTGYAGTPRIKIHSGDGGHYRVTYTTTGGTLTIKATDFNPSSDTLASGSTTSSAFDVYLTLPATTTARVIAQVSGSSVTTQGVYIYRSPTLTVGYPNDPNGDGDTTDALSADGSGSKTAPALINAPIDVAFTALVTDPNDDTPDSTAAADPITSAVPGVVVTFRVSGGGTAGGWLVFDSARATGTSNLGTLVTSANRERIVNGTQLQTDTDTVLYIRTDANGRATVGFQPGTNKKQDVTVNAVSQSKTVSVYTGTSVSEKALVNPRSTSRAGKYDVRVTAENDEREKLTGETVQFTTNDGTLDDPSNGTAAQRTPLDVTTDGNGVAFVVFDPDNDSGTLTVTARIWDPGTDTNLGTPDDTILAETIINVRGGTGTPPQNQQQQQTQTDAITFNLGTSIRGNTNNEITLEARVTDRDGFRVPRVPVSFTISDSDVGSLSVSSGDTNSGGVVRTVLTLGDEDGTITASAAGYTSAQASITIEPAPAGLEVASGSGQTGTPGSTLSSPFVVRFEDTEGNPISGAQVTFTVETGGGSLSRSTDTTDSDGEAETTLTLGSVGMRNTVRASVDSAAYPGISSITFTAEAARGPEAVVIAGGDRQIGQIGQLLDEDLSVQVVDGNDDGVSGILVRFRISEGRGRLARNSARTDNNGYAEIGFTPTAHGETVVEAYSTGLTSAFFTITTGEPPDDILKVSGDNQSGSPGSRLANPFVVEVVDENDDPVSDVTITFAVTAGGGSLSVTSVTTNGTGRAQTYLRLGDDIGENTVVASVSGLSDRVTFTARTGAEVLVSAAQRPPMYWISRTEGKLHRLVDEEVENLAPNIDGILSLTVDTQNELLYWTRQTAKNKSAIQRAGLNGRGVITLQTSLTLMTSIAVDSTGTTLYWADILGKIKSRPVQGNRVTLLAQNLSSPTGLVWANEYLYWGEATGQIRRMNLRNNRRTIETITTSSGEPVSLAVRSGRVYWTEISGNAAQLNRVNTNGTGLEALKTLTGSKHVWLDVDGSDSKIYLTRANKLERRNLSGRSTVDLVTGLQSPGSLVLGGTLPPRSPVVSQPTQPTQPAQPTAASKYDVNRDGAVNNADTRAVAGAVGQSGDAITNPRTDVDGSGTVDVTDLILVIANLDADVAAPTIDIDVKALDVDFDRVQEQVEVLLASGDRSIAAQRALLYLQHLLASARPDETVLLANYPNPFNPETWIPYHLAESTDVRVNIYDSQGVLVRVLPLGHQTAGYYTSRSRAAYWDGRNALGERVASGIYFYQLQTDTVSPMRKMVILK